MMTEHEQMDSIRSKADAATQQASRTRKGTSTNGRDRSEEGTRDKTQRHRGNREMAESTIVPPCSP